MTWSIVALDRNTGAVAAAVTTKAFASGARCPHVRAGVGAVSTQSMTNPYLGPVILDNLARGLDAETALKAAIAGDAGRGIRQVHVVDMQGRVAAWTGDNCVTWCGHRLGDGFSVAGNMLNPKTVDATFAAFEANAALPMPERMITALDAGEAAGGDKRGRQSAGLLLATTEDFPDINLRVDDHTAPLTELRRLLGLWRAQAEPRRSWFPSKANPAGETNLDLMEAAWAQAGLDLKFRR